MLDDDYAFITIIFMITKSHKIKLFYVLTRRLYALILNPIPPPTHHYYFGLFRYSDEAPHRASYDTRRCHYCQMRSLDLKKKQIFLNDYHMDECTT